MGNSTVILLVALRILCGLFVIGYLCPEIFRRTIVYFGKFAVEIGFVAESTIVHNLLYGFACLDEQLLCLFDSEIPNEFTRSLLADLLDFPV